jgi:DNA polymerase III alpha subunit
MISWFNKIQEQRREVEERRARAQRQRDMELRKARLQESKELRLITINNVRYISCYLRTLHSVVNCVKGSSMAETKRKRDWARKKISWLEGKLEEEKAMVDYWDMRVKKLSQ